MQFTWRSYAYAQTHKLHNFYLLYQYSACWASLNYREYFNWWRWPKVSVLHVIHAPHIQHCRISIILPSSSWFTCLPKCYSFTFIKTPGYLWNQVCNGPTTLKCLVQYGTYSLVVITIPSSLPTLSSPKFTPVGSPLMPATLSIHTSVSQPAIVMSAPSTQPWPPS